MKGGVVRKQYRGRIGPVSRKKRVNPEYPVEPVISDILSWHRERMLRVQHPGVEEGYMFPSKAGKLRYRSSLAKAWDSCLAAANIETRVTPHSMLLVL